MQEQSTVTAEDVASNQATEERTPQNQEQNGSPVEEEQEPESDTFSISVKTCGEKSILIPLQVSPSDNMQDIRQFLFESVETCHVTAYHLAVNGEILNDYADISQLPLIQPGSVLVMQESLYEERSIRYHVRRLRELISPATPDETPSVFGSLSISKSRVEESNEKTGAIESNGKKKKKGKGKGKEKKDEKEEKEEGKEEKAEEKKVTEEEEIGEVVEQLRVQVEEQTESLAAFFPPSLPSPSPPLRSLTLSGWNPPPGPRRLVGDLIYLEVVTLEGTVHHVTGSALGFFVNGSSTLHFHPLPAQPLVQAHELVDLLVRLSPRFAQGLEKVLSRTFEEHPFALLPVPFPPTAWLGQEEEHRWDLNRAEDALFAGGERDGRGQLRDWNEELQSCRELPRGTVPERILRDRAIVKVNCDFVEAATKGAMAIISKTIPPINPLDPPGAHMFIFHNIFFSWAKDGRDLFKNCGGDRAAWSSVKNDLQGIRSMNRVDPEGLHTLATCLIDWRGQRLCAQGIIPGILQREQTSTVLYGSIDGGKAIVSDPTFHQLVQQVAPRLHLKQHLVKSSDGTAVALSAPVEAKGIVGTDGRRYLLDLIRLTPRDLNYSGKVHSLCILRPELVQSYADFLSLVAKRKEAAVKKAKEAERKKEEEVNKEEGGKGEKEDGEKEDKGEKEEKEGEKEVELLLNPNIDCDFELADSPEEIANDRSTLEALAKYLKDQVIPSFVQEFSRRLVTPEDGVTLTTLMHVRGINMRYLGAMAQQAMRPEIKLLLEREMVARAAKHVLRSQLAQVEEYNVGPFVAHFLNCFLGSHEGVTSDEGKRKGKSGKKKPVAPSPLGEIFSLRSAELWKALRGEVMDRFGYSMTSTALPSLGLQATLRAFALKVGLQVLARDYAFDSPQPFQTSDILHLSPMVKHLQPETADGQNLLEAGKAFLAQGRLDIAYELLQQALAVFHQVYGPMHSDTGECYSTLAMVLYHANDLSQALDHQQKATLISERVKGVDHHDTVHCYGNLALFCRALTRPLLSLRYVQRAVYLGRLVCGPLHPDILNLWTNAAFILQDAGQHQLSVKYLMEALKLTEVLFDPDHIQVAALNHSIAVAYSHLGEYKEALTYEKKNYSILQGKLAENDKRMVESNMCLKQFTAKAVEVGKSQLEAKKRNSPQLPLQGMGLNARPTKSAGMSIPAATDRSMGERSINEILSYLNEKSPSGSFSQRNEKSKKKGGKK